MNDDDRGLQELMNAQLDGVATAEESERLRHVLESRADLRAEYEKLGGVILALEQLGMEEPPAALKLDVLRAVRVNTATERERGGWLGTVAALFGGGRGPRQATSFAAGAALGVLLFAILSGQLTTRQGADTRSMTGTMLPLSGSGSGRLISSHEFTLHRGRVLAETLSGRDGFDLRLTSDAPVGTEVVASFEPGDWVATSVGQNATGNEVMLGTGRLSVRIRQPGQSQYLLHLARRGPAGSSLRIAIHSPDGFVQGELETRARRSGS
jgi:hypothetical protein